MRATLTAEQAADGWIMTCTLPDGTIEYPQEGRVYPDEQDIYDNMSMMYDCSAWDYDASDNTIEIG